MKNKKNIYWTQSDVLNRSSIGNLRLRGLLLLLLLAN